MREYVLWKDQKCAMRIKSKEESKLQTVRVLYITLKIFNLENNKVITGMS